MRGDAGSVPTRDTKFFFHFRDVRRKPPVISCLHLSIIISSLVKAVLVTQVTHIKISVGFL